uniref:FAD-binding domain-containing protein n=1 Tax=Mycena chlorophos TaxID=658473 RepID=A0ABQ0L2Z9_MYCCL|nr:predicted protein [Mycena chlorophos]
MSSTHTTVLVVGAGPTGLTAALTLLKNGVQVRIIDAAAETHDAARGTALMPRTQELLEILGAMDDIKAVATGPLQMAVYTTSPSRRRADVRAEHHPTSNADV